jgi:hypothetical protein
VDIRELPKYVVLTYWAVPKPCTVDVRDDELTYWAVPRPCTVDIIEPDTAAVLI